MKPHELLREIVIKNGSKLCSNRNRCKAIISDTFKNSYGREKNLLYVAINEGVVDELITNSNDIKINAPRFVDKLVQEQGIQKIHAQWAVYAWGYAICAISDSVLIQIEEKLSENCAKSQLKKQLTNSTISSGTKSVVNTQVVTSSQFPTNSISQPVSSSQIFTDVTLIHTLKGHSGKITSVAITPDGKYIVSGSSDHQIKMWDLVSGLNIKSFNVKDWVDAIAISPNGKYVFAGCFDKTIKILDLTFGDIVATLKGHTGWITSIYAIVISPDGRYAISGSGDNTIKIWDIITKQCIKTLDSGGGYTGDVRSLGISPDGRLIVSGHYNHFIKLWNLVTNECINTLEIHSRAVYAVKFSPDGRIVISGSGDKTLKIWDIIANQVRTMIGHKDSVLSVAISPDGNTLISGSADKTLKIWNISTEKCIKTLEGHSDKVLSVAISPDGRTIVSGSKDKTIKVWSL